MNSVTIPFRVGPEIWILYPPIIPVLWFVSGAVHSNRISCLPGLHVRADGALGLTREIICSRIYIIKDIAEVILRCNRAEIGISLGKADKACMRLETYVILGKVIRSQILVLLLARALYPDSFLEARQMASSLLLPLMSSPGSST